MVVSRRNCFSLTTISPFSTHPFLRMGIPAMRVSPEKPMIFPSGDSLVLSATFISMTCPARLILISKMLSERTSPSTSFMVE